MASITIATEPGPVISAPAIGALNVEQRALANKPDNSLSKDSQSLLTNNPGEIKLYWTAPGDDGYTGRAARYEVRYWGADFGPIDNDWKWRRATQVGGTPLPSMAGSTDSMTVGGLEYGGPYYFCLRAYDEAGNQSPLSASVLFTAGDTSSGMIIPGDANGNGEVRGNDVLYLVSYFRGANPPPNPYLNGDANGDCTVDMADITYLTRYLKGLGDPPVMGQCFRLRDSQISDNSLTR
jgi:hypothetical protein